jgi:hypothetical protein
MKAREFFRWKNGSVWLMDKNAQRYCGTSRYLNKKEFRKIYKGTTHPPRNLYFVFRYGIPMEVPILEALVLIKKFDCIVEMKKSRDTGRWEEAGTVDELDKMKRPELMKLAGKYKLSSVGMTNVALIEEIRRLIREGVVPMSDEEYEAYKEEKKGKK